MLVIKNVVKEYTNGMRANDDISLTIKEGEIFGLLGPNGAGKTTLVSQIMGVLKPSSGSISIGGVNVIEKPKKAREMCSLQPQSQVSIQGLTPRQAIELTGRIRKGNKHEVRKRTDYLLKMLNIEPWADKMATNLSGGIKRLVIFCMTSVVPGKLVIFDEPTNDVDPMRRRLLWNQMRTLAEEGCAVLLVTHNVLESEQSVNRLAIIDKGKMLVSGTPYKLKADFAGNLRLQLVVNSEYSIPYLPKFANVTTHNGSRVLLSIPNHFVGEAVQWAEQLRSSEIIEEYSLSPVTLEDAYFHWINPQRKKRLEEKQYEIV